MDPLFELKLKQAFSNIKKDITSLKQELSEYKALLKALINKLGEESQERNQNSSNNLIDGKKSSIGNKGVYAVTQSLSHSLCSHSNTHSPIQSQDSGSSTLTSKDSDLEVVENHQNILNQQQANSDQTLTSNNSSVEMLKNQQNISNYPQIQPNQTLTFDNFTQQNTTNIIQNNISHPLQTLTNKEFIVFLTIYRLEKEQPRVTYVDIANKLTLTSGCIRSYITSLIRKKAPITKSKINNKLTVLSIDPSFRSLTSEQKLLNLYYQNDPHQATLS